MSYFVLGSTGLVGSHFMEQAVNDPKVTRLVTLARRKPLVDSSKISPIVNSDLAKWPEIISKLDISTGSTMFSAFGTTRKAAGGGEQFIKIDEGTNVEAFQAAKASGKFDTAVLVSSVGANSGSYLLYPASKGRIEDNLKELKFKRTIILRPGMLLGQREQSKGWANTLGEKVGQAVYGTFLESVAGHPIQGADVAKVALYLSEQPIKEDGEVLVVNSAKMNELARTLPTP